MNRYEFEDLISDYIENNLALHNRKRFEEYLNDHPDAKMEVEYIRTMISKINQLPKKRVSKNFNHNLIEKIKNNPNQIEVPIRKNNTIFGLSAISLASILVLVCLSIYSIFEIWDLNNGGSEKFKNEYFSDKNFDTIDNYKTLAGESNHMKDEDNNFGADSSNIKEKDYSGKIKFVDN